MLWLLWSSESSQEGDVTAVRQRSQSEVLKQCCAVNVLATFGAIAFVDSLGRRKLLIAASIWMFVTQIIVAGLLGAEFQQHGAVLPSNVSVGVIVVSAAASP